jgi:hypothetical protein
MLFLIYISNKFGIGKYNRRHERGYKRLDVRNLENSIFNMLFGNVAAQIDYTKKILGNNAE